MAVGITQVPYLQASMGRVQVLVAASEVTVMASTLPLNYDTWDLTLDAAGNWTATDDQDIYVPQTTANKWLLFTNDSYLFPREGNPYRRDTLGKKYPQSLIIEHLKRSAMRVVGARRCTITSIEYDVNTRTVTAEGVVTTRTGEQYNVSIG